MKKLNILLLSFFLCSILCFSQDTIKRIGLVWDTSYGMIDRDLNAELDYLDQYFTARQGLEVILVIFSNTILVQEEHTVTNGQWSKIRQELRNSIPDGATSFTDIFPKNVDEIIFITDGRSAYGQLQSTANKPVNVIYSVRGGNIATLQALALNSGGQFINLLTDDRSAKPIIKSEFINIKGRVTANGEPLEGAIVQSIEIGASTSTNSDGQYIIKAGNKGTLRYSHFGKQTYIARVPINGIKNVEMQDGTETLDEVLITADKRPVEQVVSLGMEKRTANSIGYAVETINEDDISEQDIDLETAVTGQFSNVHIKSDQDITQFLARGRNMSILLDQTGLIVVDGVPMPSDPQLLGGVASDKSLLSKSGLLSPDNIAEISVLKGLAATNKWGTLGRNGVILVTTKSGSPNYRDNGAKQEVSLGTTDTYQGGALVMSDSPNTEYIEALKTAGSVDEAYKIYLQQREYFGKSPSFFFDTANFFRAYKNNFVIEKILSNVAELSSVKKESKMALSYMFQDMELYDSASLVLNDLIEDNPKEVQHYRNLALNYTMAGKYDEALSLYKLIDRKQIKGISAYDNLQGTLDNEYKNLLGLHGDDMKLSGINPKMLTNLQLDTRVVIEWNKYDAEFDLQIVNPQNRYFTWSHTKKAEPERFKRETEIGYGLEEYFMTAEDKGIWLFNLTYLGEAKEENKEPLYIKITKYDNFGSKNQSQHTKVIAVDELNKTQTLMTIKIE